MVDGGNTQEARVKRGIVRWGKFVVTAGMLFVGTVPMRGQETEISQAAEGSMDGAALFWIGVSLLMVSGMIGSFLASKPGPNESSPFRGKAWEESKALKLVDENYKKTA